MAVPFAIGVRPGESGSVTANRAGWLGIGQLKPLVSAIRKVLGRLIATFAGAVRIRDRVRYAQVRA